MKHTKNILIGLLDGVGTGTYLPGYVAKRISGRDFYSFGEAIDTGQLTDKDVKRGSVEYQVAKGVGDIMGVTLGALGLFIPGIVFDIKRNREKDYDAYLNSMANHWNPKKLDGATEVPQETEQVSNRETTEKKELVIKRCGQPFGDTLDGYYLKVFLKRNGYVLQEMEKGSPSTYSVRRETEEGTYTGQVYGSLDGTLAFQKDSSLANVVRVLCKNQPDLRRLMEEAKHIGQKLTKKYDSENPPYNKRDGAGFYHTDIPGWFSCALNDAIENAFDGEPEEKIRKCFLRMRADYSGKDLEEVLSIRERASKLIKV